MHPAYNESFKYNLRYRIQKIVPSFLYPFILKYKYKKCLNRNLNLKKPQKLSEKIQWLKLNEFNQNKTNFADKLFIKKYINENIPDLKCAKVYQIADNFENINFDELPNSFVIKTNHAWKTHAFIFNKKNLKQEKINLLKRSFNKVLNINYAYWSFYELHYSDIKPQIFIEEILNHTGNYEVLPSFEVYCINGNPEFILHRIFTNDFEQKIYNTKWEELNFNIEYGGKTKIEKPIFLERMLNYSIKLSKKFKFARIDFFQVNDELYFSEVTFTPYSGFIKFIPESVDLLYGEKLKF